MTGAEPGAAQVAEPAAARGTEAGHRRIAARPLRILVDGRVMQDRYHGIGRYTHELLRELSRRETELIVLHSPDSGRLDVAEMLTRRTVRAIPSGIPVASLRSQWVLLRAVLTAQPDVVFVPYHLSTPVLAGRVPVVSVIHDCVFERDAAARGPSAFSRVYRASTRQAIRSAAALVAPSEAARRDIRRFYGAELPAEAVLPHGVGGQFFSLRGRPAPPVSAFPIATSCTWDRSVRTRTSASWWKPWRRCGPATPVSGSSWSASPIPGAPTRPESSCGLSVCPISCTAIPA